MAIVNVVAKALQILASLGPSEAKILLSPRRSLVSFLGSQDQGLFILSKIPEALWHFSGTYVVLTSEGAIVANISMARSGILCLFLSVLEKQEPLYFFGPE